MTDISGQRTTVWPRRSASAAVLNAVGLVLANLQPRDRRLLVEQFHRQLVRGESERYPSYEIWIAPENGFLSFERLLQSAGAFPVGPDALELYRIALGIPRYGQDIRERDLPQETEQQRALNFNKGCYVGQEIVERIRSRGNVHRKFTGFQVRGAPPPPGTKILSARQGCRRDHQFCARSRAPVATTLSRWATSVVKSAFRQRSSNAGDSSALVTELPFTATLAT